MRRTIALIIAAALLCACGGDRVDAAGLNAASSACAGKDRHSGQYMLEITFAENTATLYYARGDFEYDRAGKTASLDFSQTWLGSSSKARNDYKDGVITNTTDGETFEVPREAELLFSQFPYFAPPLCLETDSNLSEHPGARGTQYTFVRKNASDFCKAVVGGDVCDLVPALRQPRREETSFGDVAFTCLVEGESLLSFGCEFDVTLYDTPAYIPGYSVPEEEYVITLHVTARVSYDE